VLRAVSGKAPRGRAADTPSPPNTSIPIRSVSGARRGCCQRRSSSLFGSPPHPAVLPVQTPPQKNHPKIPEQIRELHLFRKIQLDLRRIFS
jgi:hypothetical protein